MPPISHQEPSASGHEEAREPVGALTLDGSALASSPGGLRVGAWSWARRHPKWPLRLGLSFALALTLALFVSAIYWVPVVLLIPLNWLYWRRIREHFLHGDACPGLVVQPSPVLVAVRTDLSKGWGSYPALKVIEESRCAQWPTPLAVGHRVATVASYTEHDKEGMPFWKDFDPHSVDALVDDPGTARRLLERFEEGSWRQLESGIAQLESLRPGLFRIHEPGCSWPEDA